MISVNQVISSFHLPIWFFLSQSISIYSPYILNRIMALCMRFVFIVQLIWIEQHDAQIDYVIDFSRQMILLRFKQWSLLWKEIAAFGRSQMVQTFFFYFHQSSRIPLEKKQFENKIVNKMFLHLKLSCQKNPNWSRIPY